MNDLWAAIMAVVFWAIPIVAEVLWIVHCLKEAA